MKPVVWLSSLCYTLNTRKRTILKNFAEKENCDDLASRITRGYAHHTDVALTEDDVLLIIKNVPLVKAPKGAVKELLELTRGM
jgi:hypothetical protein